MTKDEFGILAGTVTGLGVFWLLFFLWGQLIPQEWVWWSLPAILTILAGCVAVWAALMYFIEWMYDRYALNGSATTKADKP